MRYVSSHGAATDLYFYELLRYDTVCRYGYGFVTLWTIRYFYDLVTYMCFTLRYVLFRILCLFFVTLLCCSLCDLRQIRVQANILQVNHLHQKPSVAYQPRGSLGHNTH